jgi:transposase-like protein
MVLDHELDYESRWATVASISAKIGCAVQTLPEWVKKAEIDAGGRAGVPTEVAAKLKALEEALHARQTARRGDLIHHSGRDSQYLSTGYTERRSEADIEPSLAESAIAMTTLWPRRATASTKPRSSITAVAGGHSRTPQLLIFAIIGVPATSTL